MLNFKVNNNRNLCISQVCPDGEVTVYTRGEGASGEKSYKIPAGDFVMLLNLYRHIKENNIYNEYVNPHGANKEV